MLLLDFINVGYGDAVLIRNPDTGYAMLVDCGDVSVGGNQPQRVSAADFLRQEGVSHLDLLVLTHLHRDHCGGLTKLLQAVRVGEFWTNYLPPEPMWKGTLLIPKDVSAGGRCLLESMNIYLAALLKMKDEGTRLLQICSTEPARELTPGLRIEVYLEDAPVHLRQAEIWKAVLDGCPERDALDELDRFINNTSIRLRLTFAGRSIELPGDTYAACWEKHALCPCTIVKLPHHGHGDSMTEALYERLSPDYCVISTSNTRTDNCPSAEVYEMIRRHRGQCLFTDAVRLTGVHPHLHSAIRFGIHMNGEVEVNFVQQHMQKSAVL